MLAQGRLVQLVSLLVVAPARVDPVPLTTQIVVAASVAVALDPVRDTRVPARGHDSGGHIIVWAPNTEGRTIE